MRSDTISEYLIGRYILLYLHCLVTKLLEINSKKLADTPITNIILDLLILREVAVTGYCNSSTHVL